MGRAVLPAALLLLTACGGGTPKPMMPKGQIIPFSDAMMDAGGTDTIRFGRMRSGETAVKTLLLHNASQKPVAVTSYTRTCGCTTLEFDSQPVIPGDTLPLRIVFDSRGLIGWQFKSLDVQLAGSTAPLKIYIDAEVE